MAEAFARYYLERKGEVQTDAFSLLRSERDKEQQALAKAQTELQDFQQEAKSLPAGSSEKA